MTLSSSTSSERTEGDCESSDDVDSDGSKEAGDAGCDSDIADEKRGTPFHVELLLVYPAYMELGEAGGLPPFFRRAVSTMVPL